MKVICSKKTGEKLTTLTIGQSISNGRINSRWVIADELNRRWPEASHVSLGPIRVNMWRNAAITGQGAN